MKYKILTERDKKIRAVFNKLIGLAYNDSGPISSKVMGWAPDRGYKAGFRPGDLIKKLNEEDRKTISELTIDDIKNIDNGILQLINWEQQNASERTFWKQMRTEFEKFINDKKLKITYRGWPGHFICSMNCVFRLNTLIEYGNKRIVVSTVGQMFKDVNDRKKGFDTIGCGIFYETMAFWACNEKTPIGNFWDADISKQVPFSSKWCWDKLEDELNAQNGHEKVVKEIAKKLEKGKL